ncbi:Putative DUF3857 domain-containing protein [Candidatus Trichorickettsia mobilis]|uniref:DUF3857 domain-containing protein n=1 Tax=Candidatus Trichorickettsia mobilis TaxID=1346319 RepID=A0ABZ0UTG5_9RICK|nr:hypothetical protein [Candidatus Trichorickettsia mobilis]WPY01324.1 Putative DUF3857 domain-containing protein [Candidatus Trichorickettsia mobilis]
MYDFNHAIVKVIDANKKVCWIDPSAKANIINGVLPNISDKFVLVLNGSESTYEKIPLISEENAQILLDQIIDSDVTYANISFKGEAASYLTASGIYSSKEKIINDFCARYIPANNIKANNILQISMPKLNSKLIETINISLSYKNNDLLLKSNLGKIYFLNNNFSIFKEVLNTDIKTSANDLSLKFPQTITRRTVFKNTKIPNIDNLDFVFDGPFISMSRKSSINSQDSIIVEKAVIHKSWIRNDEIKTIEFQNLKDIIQSNIYNTVAIIQ